MAVETSSVGKAKLQQNRQQGIAEGLELGTELGDTCGRKAVARPMVTEGINMATIARLTGLSEAELVQLQSES